MARAEEEKNDDYYLQYVLRYVFIVACKFLKLRVKNERQILYCKDGKQQWQTVALAN